MTMSAIQGAAVKFGGVRFYAEWLAAKAAPGKYIPSMTAEFFDTVNTGEKDPGAVYFQTVCGDKFKVQAGNRVIADYTEKLHAMNGFNDYEKGERFLNDIQSRSEIWDTVQYNAHAEGKWFRLLNTGKPLFETVFGTPAGGFGFLADMLKNAAGLNRSAQENTRHRKLFVDSDGSHFKSCPTLVLHDEFRPRASA